MSKKINLDNPLSEADREYLLSRDRHDEVAFNAVVTGTKLPSDVADAIKERGINEEDVRRRAEAAGKLSTDSETSEVSEAASGDDSGPDDGPKKFSEDWFDKATIKELSAELKARDLPVTGKRDELADRLYDHMVDKGEITGEESEEDSES